MTLCALSLQPLDYVKGYAEALSEVKAFNDEAPDTYQALTQCLNERYDDEGLLRYAVDLPTKEHGMGRVQAFGECAEAYRQLGEIYGWDSASGLGDFISWRSTLAQGLINKQQERP